MPNLASQERREQLPSEPIVQRLIKEDPDQVESICSIPSGSNYGQRSNEAKGFG